ncbi:MAG: hypothetical protein CMK09_07270 [Ponticaulis sp.]|nr:hypothetical protein [Ponticaulis sp.]|tara:strand:- start:2028 stop:3872 length:1845 start_codon:yes stop_codon:yes gene_type:complete
MVAFAALFQRQWFNVLLGIFALAAIVLGAFGWAEVYEIHVADEKLQSPPPGEELAWKISYIAANTLRAFLFADMYASPWDVEFNWPVTFAGWLGSFVFASALIKGAIRVFSKPLARMNAVQRSGHVVVIGTREIAVQACVSLVDKGWKVTYHGDTGGEALEGALVVPRPVDADDAFLAKSVRRANRVIIAEDSDSLTSELAVKMAKTAPDSIVFALLENPWVATNLRQANLHGLDLDGKEDHLIAVSETRALARAALIPSPPFMYAEQYSQRRIHILIYGFNSLAMALFEETLYSNIVPGINDSTVSPRLDHPRFTFLTPNAYAAKAEFDARHPDFEKESRRSNNGSIAVEFIECPLDCLTAEAVANLKPLLAANPLTLAYVTSSDRDEPLAGAFALQTGAKRHDLFKCPILAQSRNGNGALRAVGTELDPLGVYSFGQWDDVIMALGVLDKEPDALAKAYHENYRREVLNRHGSDERWEVLPEVFRMANRNAVLHLPAKLASMGLDINPYLERPDALSPSTAPEIHPDVVLVASEEEAAKLSELEHERWMVERWVTGWRYGPRDNVRRHHPNLVPFQQLDEQTQRMDRVFVDWLSRWIDKDKDVGLRRGGKSR